MRPRRGDKEVLAARQIPSNCTSDETPRGYSLYVSPWKRLRKIHAS